jgi:hypothetical protein
MISYNINALASVGIVKLSTEEIMNNDGTIDLKPVATLTDFGSRISKLTRRRFL